MADEHTQQGLRGRDLAGLGGVLVAGVVVGLVIGMLADNYLGTGPKGALVGLGLGMFLAIFACVHRVLGILQRPGR